jgi:hypothetical protein
VSRLDLRNDQFELIYLSLQIGNRGSLVCNRRMGGSRKRQKSHRHRSKGAD